ncbi:TetR/AcrR family transcriptional regulator [Paenibacillus sp. GCM10027627]|uniref:TetR/AcrR family transcriptional regulator n=1 Tax=unclassified Paenibacillus TaxID=185978 RepID=UPI003637632C
MDGFERRKQKKMENIYGVSLELFFKFGFQKVSVNEIAHKAKVSPATIYNYFGTKEQLYSETLVYWMDKQLVQYESILDSELSFSEKTKQIMLLEASNVKVLSEELPKALSSELDGLIETMESYSERKIEAFFAKYVALGKREGFIREDQSEEMAMRYFSMFKNELVRHWGASVSRNGRSIGNIDEWLEMFFYGLTGGAPRSPR